MRFGILATALAVALGISPAAQAQKVVVYTAAKQSLVDELTTAFQKETGIKVELVMGGSSDLIRRVRAEASAPKVDVIWSIGGEVLEANKDVLQAFTPAANDMILPAYRISPEWIPFSGILAAFAVNTKSLKPSEYPTTWKDLADPKWKGQIASARADSSGSAFQQYATVLAAYGDTPAPGGGWDVYKRILANMQLAQSSGLVSRLVNDGEAKVGIVLEDDALDYVKGGGPIAVVYPADGTSTVADGMALAKGAPNAENGRKFIDWLLTRPAQEAVVKSMGRRPVRTDVAGGGGARPIAEVKLVNYVIRMIATKRNDWIARWKEMEQAR
jgi:iron(III) transport system substrate-binding protein